MGTDGLTETFTEEVIKILTDLNETELTGCPT
jgi:hypothetical protein